MKRYLLVTAIAIATLSTGTRVSAHHSFSATYLEGKVATVEGDVVQFQYRNPHSFVYVNVKNKAGEIEKWAIEWGAGGQLGSQGVNRDSVKPGDHVIITGDPSRQPGELRLRMRSILRPSDGWKWSGDFQ